MAFTTVSGRWPTTNAPTTNAPTTVTEHAPTTVTGTMPPTYAPTTTRAPTTNAPTTNAPTTNAPTTVTEHAPTTVTHSLPESQWPPSYWLSLFVGKLKTVFDKNRTGKIEPGRPYLLRKWQRQADKFSQRYDDMVDKNCQFDINYENNGLIDYSFINTCKVNNSKQLKFGEQH